MLQQRWLYVAVATVACILQAQGADKYTDENRPYEFGFNIDGEQHRHEKKGKPIQDFISNKTSTRHHISNDNI